MVALSRRLPAAAVLVLAGCSPAAPTLYPVTGQVFFEGKPAEGATVVFHQPDAGTDSYRPGAVVQADGSYTLNTYPYGPGAPAGDYVVLLTWFDKPAKEGADGKSKLPARYSDADQSGLRVTVKPGDNRIDPFQLTRKAR